MPFTPLYDRVLLRRQEEQTTSPGGIVLPGASKEKSNIGTIVATGAGRVMDNGELRPLTVKVGDLVAFGPYSGSNTVKVDGEDLLVVAESEILGIHTL